MRYQARHGNFHDYCILHFPARLSQQPSQEARQDPRYPRIMGAILTPDNPNSNEDRSSLRVGYVLGRRLARKRTEIADITRLL